MSAKRRHPDIHPDDLLTVQELADALKRSTRYVRYMQQIGFRMTGQRATLASAIAFLERRPWPTSKRWRQL